MEYWQSRITRDVSDKDAYLQLGVLEEHSGFYSAAERHLESARALGVEDKFTSGSLGRVYMHLSKEDRAYKELEKAVALEPSKWEPVANLAGFYADRDESAKSLGLITEFWQKAPHDSLSPKDLERICIAFTEGKDKRRAYEVAQYLTNKHPEYVGGIALMARAAFATGDLAVAKTYTEKALNNAPKDTVILYFYGLVLREMKDKEGAVRVWEKAVALNPNAVDIYERLGEEYAQRGEYKKAASAWEYVAKKDQQPTSALNAAHAFESAKLPDDAAYWYALAYGLQGDFPKTLEQATRASHTLDTDKKYRALRTMAEAYRGMGKKTEYLATILKATQRESADDYLLRAHTYAYFDQPLKQEEALRLAIIKNPKREVGLRYDLGMLLSSMGRPDDAETEFNKAIALDPKNPVIKLELARKYVKRSSVRDNLEKATELTQQALTVDSQNDSAWMLLGQCYAEKKAFAKAVNCLEHAVDLEPGNGPAYLELGRLYAQLGNSAKSQEAMQLYQRYVAFEQEKQTRQTRAKRNGSTSADVSAYADLLLKAGYIAESLKQYKIAYAKDPNNSDLKQKIDRLNRQSEGNP